MTDSRVLTRDEFEKTIWDFAIDYGRCDHTEARELYAPIRIHDAAQREEIDRLKGILKRALDRWEAAERDFESRDGTGMFESIRLIRAEVFGQEGKGETKAGEGEK
jgi:hypothetical protein